MKTPWKFLSGLVSRKAADDHAAEQVTKAPDILAVEHHPVQDEKIAEEAVVSQPSDRSETYPSQPEAETIEAASATGPEFEADVVEAEVVPLDMPSPVATELVTDHVPSATSSSVQEAKQDELAGLAAIAPKPKKSVQRALARPEVVPEEEAGPAQAVVAKAVDHEMLALDQEIAELRRLLSEKLVLQNAYLKSMLDRYILKD